MKTEIKDSVIIELYPNKQDLFTTNVGSHVWNMNHAKSDIDLFTVYIAPTKDILSGKNRGCGSHCGKAQGKDIASHEIGKVIDMLITGNINFLIGVLSPIVYYERGNNLTELRNLVQQHCKTKACIASIRGLAIHNYKKYIIGSDTAREYDIVKKCGLINRNLLFGINVLKGNGFKFEPVFKQTPEDVKVMFIELEKVLENSTIPERTDSAPFREYLLELRLRELHDDL